MKEPSGHADLDEAAVVAVRQWTFTPAVRDDKPVASRITVPAQFAPPAPAPELLDTTRPGVLPVQGPVPAAPSGPAAAPAPPSPAGPADTAAALTANGGADAAVEQVDVHGHLQARPHGVPDYPVTLGA